MEFIEASNKLEVVARISNLTHSGPETHGPGSKERKSVAVIFHALSDWGIVFNKAFIDTGDVGKWQPGLWEGLSSPLLGVFLFCGLAMALLWIDRSGVPAWMHQVALKWRLVKPGFEPKF